LFLLKVLISYNNNAVPGGVCVYLHEETWGITWYDEKLRPCLHVSRLKLLDRLLWNLVFGLHCKTLGFIHFDLSDFLKTGLSHETLT